ncbi:MAG: PAS domain-containing sensor histidine kinase, partial [Promethearchaeota archaeon]
MLENKNFESKIENEIENYEESKQLISKKVMYLFEKTNYNWNLYDFFKFLEKSLNIQEIYVIPVNSSNKDFFCKYIDKRCLKFHNSLQIQEYSILNWMIQEIKENKFIYISKEMKDIPFYNYLNSFFHQDQGIKSLLIFPLFLNSKIDAFITFRNPLNLIELEDKFSDLCQASKLVNFIIQNKYNEYIFKENMEQYRLIVDNISDLILIIDTDLKIKYLNKSALRSLLKTSIKEVIGKSILNFIHENDQEIVQASLKKSFEKGFGKVEFMLKQEDDSHVVLRCLIKKFKDENEQEKLLMVCRDITEQRLAEERYRNLFDNSPNAILLINFYGNIVDSNKTVKKLFGYEKDFFIGKSIYEFPEIFLVDLKKYFKSIFSASFKDDFPEPIEIQIRTKNDEDIWVEIQASLIKQENRMLIQLLFKDITEKKKREFLEEQFKIKLENEVKKRTKELNDALKQQKLYLDQILKSSQFKTEFMATMSHELRTPLNAIIGFAELLLEGVYGPLNKDQEEFIKDIKASAEHQFEMVK